MPATRNHPSFRSLTSLLRCWLFIVAGTAAAGQFIGCTVEMDGPYSTGGSGGTTTTGVAGAGGGALVGSQSDAGADAGPSTRR
jgi:hypothetical protein